MLDSPYYKIVKVNSEWPTMIAFSVVNTPAGKFNPYKFLKEAKMNIIFVNDKGNRWYQAGIEGISDSSEQAAKQLVHLAREIGNGKVLTFGTSMGAYAALLFACLGDADSSVVFAPLSKVLLKGGRGEKHFNKKIPIIYPDLLPILKEKSIPITVFCPESDEADLLSAYNLMNLKNIDVISIAGVEHSGVQYFSLNQELRCLFFNFIENFSMQKESKIEFDRKGKIFNEPEVIPYLYEFYILKKIKKDSEKCFKYIKQISQEYPEHPRVLFYLGEGYYKNKEYEMAERVWKKVIINSPYEFDAYALLGSLYLDNGNIEDAKICLLKAQEINPWYSFSKRRLGDLYKKKKDYVLAEKYYREAVDTAVRNKKNKKALATFLFEISEKKLKEAKNIMDSLI